VLSGFWFLCAFYCFLQQQDKPRLAYATLVLCALAFLTKSTTVFLPALFLLWNRRQPAWFWLALGALIASTVAVAAFLQSDLGYSSEQTTQLQRPIVVLDSLGFYLSRLVLPQRLSIDLARPPSVVLESISWLLFFAQALFFAGPAYFLSTTKLPILCKMGAALFLLSLLPALGALPFVHQHISTAASRYAYLAVLDGAWILAESRWLV
jgi:4-amino-4-deoxy-L-arabinose transferase-like glycosyltransferase